MTMHRTRSSMASLLLVLPMLAFLSACSGLEEDHWSFPVSRSIYGSGPWGDSQDGPRDRTYSLDPTEDKTHGIHGGGDAAWIVPVILLFPVIIDLALLPVTATHDIFFVD